MKTESKRFSTPILASITTGVLLEEPFSKMHEAAEFLMGHSIWTHEFASKDLCKQMRDKLIEQHPDLDVNADDVNADNFEAFAEKLKTDLGDTLEIIGGKEKRQADPITTAREMLGGLKNE